MSQWWFLLTSARPFSKLVGSHCNVSLCKEHQADHRMSLRQYGLRRVLYVKRTCS